MFHNSKQRIDPQRQRCHENTRPAVLQEILDWIIEDAVRGTWILCLNGASGAGKTAICQSITELYIERDILVASFPTGCYPCLSNYHACAARRRSRALFSLSNPNNPSLYS